MTDKRDDAEGFVCHQISKDAPEMTAEEAAFACVQLGKRYYKDGQNFALKEEIKLIIQSQRQAAVRETEKESDEWEDQCANQAFKLADKDHQIALLVAEREEIGSLLYSAMCCISDEKYEHRDLLLSHYKEFRKDYPSFGDLQPSPLVEALARRNEVSCNALLGLDALEAENARLKDSSKWLGEIMAVMHHDGGHYLAEHGEEKAVKDALKVWYKEKAAVEALEKYGWHRSGCMHGIDGKPCDCGYEETLKELRGEK